MPYIPPYDRPAYGLDRELWMDTPGSLNYVLTEVVEQYRSQHGTSYQTINDIIGALQGAQLEFYRRVAAPYEDRKRQENGDVYAPLEDSHDT